MQRPTDHGEQRNDDKHAPHDPSDSGEAPFQMLHFLPSWLRKPLLTGSCCALLYVVTAWDHGWLPGIKSPFAAANLVDEMYVLSLASSIRDLSADNCVARSLPLDDLITAQRLKYLAITGVDYPHVECKKT